jgi:ferredoxin--NADP+ reductase
VLRRLDITEDLMKLWLEKPDGYTFKPGHYCTIGIDGLERAYSIVSAPHEDSIELFIELVRPEDGGHLTPLIWKLAEGDRVTMRPRAKGIFTFQPKYRNHMLVSTVTGVVPYISYIRDYLHRGDSGHHFYVLMGASYKHEFCYDEELSDYARKRPELVTFVPTVSRPADPKNAGWKGLTGRVNTILEDCAARFVLTPEDTLI